MFETFTVPARRRRGERSRHLLLVGAKIGGITAGGIAIELEGGLLFVRSLDALPCRVAAHHVDHGNPGPADRNDADEHQAEEAEQKKEDPETQGRCPLSLFLLAP